MFQMISKHFCSRINLALFLHVSIQFSFIFPCEYNLTVHLLARDKLTLNEANSR